MIDSFLAFMGVSAEYEIFAIVVCASVVAFICIQLLNVITALIKMVGGY